MTSTAAPPRRLAALILPVCIDDTNAANACVPDKFRALHITAATGGEPPGGFVQRLQELLATHA